MIFNTQLELNITVVDVNAIYSVNYETMLLDHAKLLYEGKCRGGQYVRKIIRLVRRSLPNLIKRDLEAKVRVFIVVEAEVIRYDQFDIITGLTVQRLIPAGKLEDSGASMIDCRNDHVVTLMQLQGNHHFEVGDVIPVRVGQCLYRIESTHILVNGYPFVPYVPERVFVNLARIAPSAKEYYKTMIKPLLDRELKRKSELDQAQWKKFSKLLHPYKTESPPGKDAVSILSMLDENGFQHGPLSIDPTINMSQLVLSTQASDNEPDMTETVTATLTRLGFRFVKWLEVMNDLTQLYATDEQFKNMQTVWKLYEEHKL